MRASLKNRRPEKYRNNRKRQRQNVVRDVRDMYIARLLRNSVGIVRGDIPPEIFQFKRAQIQLRRQIQEAKHAVSAKGRA